MRIYKTMLACSVLAGLTACSSDSIGEPQITPEATTSGYVSIAIGMPTSAGTRANDQFDDGRKEEYNVNSVAILFFSGDEANAKFYKAYSVPSTSLAPGANDPNDQITVTRNVTFDVNIVSSSSNEPLWAMAVVNYGGVMSVVNADNSLKIGDIPFTGTIQDFMKQTTGQLSSFTGINEDSFFMTNTPYTNAPGTGSTEPTGDVHILAQVDKSKIKASATEAYKNPAAEVFVERAVAKVEVIATPDVASSGIREIESIEWLINNTEPSSYIARVLEDPDATSAPYWLGYTHTDKFLSDNKDMIPSAKYRFVGAVPFNAATAYYRTYFAADPNGKGIDTGTLNLIGANPTFKPVGAGNPQYCFENTFDVAHQNILNTTKATLKVKFKGGNFLTNGLDMTTAYRVEDGVISFGSFVVNNTTVIDTYNKGIPAGTSATVDNKDMTVSGTTTLTGTNKWMKLTCKAQDGALKLTDIVLYDGTQTGTKVINFESDAVKQSVIAAINEQITFNYYTGGVAYYHVRIQHFGDDLAPWPAPKNADGSYKSCKSPEESYGNGLDAEKNFLGRWGVVRNNWYQLNVSEISKYGDPLPGEGEVENADDITPGEQKVACKVNILSWSKRDQNVHL